MTTHKLAAPLPPLWHYTCAHGRRAIGTTGVLRPGVDGLLWLTDLDAPHRDALGLTSALIACDRTQYRYAVDPADHIAPWIEARALIDPVRVAAIESTPGVMLRHWFVTTYSLTARLTDRTTTMLTNAPTPNPGSTEAQAMGCTCPVLDNAHGNARLTAGRWVFIVGCPVHAPTNATESEPTMRKE